MFKGTLILAISQMSVEELRNLKRKIADELIERELRFLQKDFHFSDEMTDPELLHL